MSTVVSAGKPRGLYRRRRRPFCRTRRGVFETSCELPSVFDPQAPRSHYDRRFALKHCSAYFGSDEDDALFRKQTPSAGPTNSERRGKGSRFERVRTEKNAKIEGTDLIPATQLYTEPYMVSSWSRIRWVPMGWHAPESDGEKMEILCS